MCTSVDQLSVSVENVVGAKIEENVIQKANEVFQKYEICVFISKIHCLNWVLENFELHDAVLEENIAFTDQRVPLVLPLETFYRLVLYSVFRTWSVPVTLRSILRGFGFLASNTSNGPNDSGEKDVQMEEGHEDGHSDAENSSDVSTF